MIPIPLSEIIEEYASKAAIDGTSCIGAETLMSLAWQARALEEWSEHLRKDNSRIAEYTCAHAHKMDIEAVEGGFIYKGAEWCCACGAIRHVRERYGKWILPSHKNPEKIAHGGGS